MEKKTECSFNEDQERHSTLSLIEYGDACSKSKVNVPGQELSDFGAWSDRDNYVTTVDKQHLKISIDQRVEGAGTRKKYQAKYCNNPEMYTDQYKRSTARCVKQLNQTQEADNHSDGCLPSQPTGHKSDNESATGDGKEKLIPENTTKRSSNKNPVKPCSSDDLDGPMCIACYVKYQDSGDVPSHQTPGRRKCSVFQPPAKTNAVFWKQTFGYCGVRRHQLTSSGAMKDIFLSAHKNNVLWLSRCPQPVLGKSEPKAPAGCGAKEHTEALPMRIDKRRGSDGLRREQLCRPVPSSPTTKRSQTPLNMFLRSHLRSLSSVGRHAAPFPRSAPPQALLVESSRMVYSTNGKASCYL